MMIASDGKEEARLARDKFVRWVARRLIEARAHARSVSRIS